jgi:dihydrofolate synthase/folylpolyglutamate synthase
VEVVVDVGHNPQAARALSAWLRAQPARTTHAVFAALADKDSAGVVAALAGDIEAWYLAGSEPAGRRGQTVAALAGSLAGSAAADGTRHANVAAAIEAAVAAAGSGGRVLVFGSFHAAAAGLAALQGSAGDCG